MIDSLPAANLNNQLLPGFMALNLNPADVKIIVLGHGHADHFGNAGRVDCGTTAAAKTFNITNTGNQAFAWNATLAKGAASPFTFSPTSGNW